MNGVLERWEKLLSSLKADMDAGFVLQHVMGHYYEGHRVYHTFRHIENCLREFDAVRHQIQHPAEVEAAIWFHDVIYCPRSDDNERRSADFADSVLLEASKTPLEVAGRICDLILSTRLGAIPTTDDGLWLSDIDLSILGYPPEEFEEYERQIRREYAHVPEDVFKEKRTEILRSILSREHIYHKDYFRRRYGRQALENLGVLGICKYAKDSAMSAMRRSQGDRGGHNALE